MNPYRNLIWLILPVLLMALAGCEATEDAEHTYSQIEIKLAPSVSQQAINITRIKITVEGSNLEPREFMVEAGQRRLDTSLIIPSDAAGISVEAYEVDANDQERLALKGEVPREELAQPAPKITVWLYPVTAHLKLKASKIELSIGEVFTVEVLAVNVTDLFGVSLEIEFDSRLLEPTGVIAGTLLGNDPLVFDDLSLNRPAGRLGIAVAMRGGNTGVEGSGAVAVVSFRAKSTGTAAIRVASRPESEVLSLERPGGDPIPYFERLTEFAGRAEVTVNIR